MEIYLKTRLLEENNTIEDLKQNLGNKRAKRMKNLKRLRENHEKIQKQISN